MLADNKNLAGGTDLHIFFPEREVQPTLPEADVYKRQGIMGFAGWPWKLYNDIPSLMGYMSLALIIYKVGIKPLNRLLEWTNRFSYEWYLVHMLVLSLIHI